MTDEAKARCSICKRPLDSPSDPTSLDCGGDCLRCMALIAEDPDCMTSYIETQAREIERLREALGWALAEIEGRTRYQTNTVYTAAEQRQNALDCARAALAGDSHDQ